MFKEFGVTNLEVTKDDIYKNPATLFCVCMMTMN